jgi:hypothetical protein
MNPDVSVEFVFSEDAAAGFFRIVDVCVCVCVCVKVHSVTFIKTVIILPWLWKLVTHIEGGM